MRLPYPVQRLPQFLFWVDPGPWWEQPENGNNRDQRKRGNRSYICHGNRCNVKCDGRDLLAPVFQRRRGALGANLTPQGHVSKPGKNTDRCIERRRERRQTFDADPLGGEGKKRETKKETRDSSTESRG